RNKKKNLYASIIIILISVIGFSSDVIAVNYTFGFKANDELIWKCHVCDINKMNDIFGENWTSTGLFENISQGKKMKWQINTIDENLTSLLANINIWIWDNEENWDFYDYSTELSFLKNPSQYNSNYNFSNVIPFVPFWFPVPVGLFLSSLKLESMYDIDTRVLPTLNVDINLTERILIIAIYNSEGILNSLKFYTNGNVVILDIEFEFLPIYVLPATLGLIGTFFIAIILYVKKKRKN
ncbi:MAG: hypothetical protein ACXABG_07820, partial [Promethearchaeota archaeon]